MSEKTLHINMIPRDLLFCRDARPMEGTWSGCGGFLPGPATLHGAVVAEYCRRFPAELNAKYSDKLTSGLRVVGPFLKKNNSLYFTTPLDITPDNQCLELKKLEGSSDLPEILDYALFSMEASKNTTKAFMSFDHFQKYLAGIAFEKKDEITEAENAFFDRESRPGITIAPDKRTAVDGQFYDAQYLRLKADVSLAGDVIMNCDNELGELFTPEHRTMQLGGQQTFVYVEPQMNTKMQLPQVEITGKFVKYVLLTPCAFLSGWLPDFVDKQTGKVILKADAGDRPERLPGETRSEYRKRLVKVPIEAKLIAARVGKPLAISGWKFRNNGGGAPKATHLYVPAGSVYYFEAQDNEQAKLLAKSLSGRPLSAFGARAGYGIGVCGNFTIN